MIDVIKGTSIEDTWRSAIYQLFKFGRIYTIDEGSFEGSRRLEFYPLVVLEITYPATRPLAVTTPEGANIPSPSSEQYIQEYLDKLVNSHSKSSNEDYVYAQYLEPQLPYVIEKLRKGRGGTNQATITVGDSNSINLNDPPCLKVIDFRATKNNIIASTLDMIVYFRSWDLWAGFPNNLAALELLREYVYEEIRFGSSYSGSILAISKGLHLYEYVWSYAEALNQQKLFDAESEALSFVEKT
jgi:thymidylate synthase